MGELLKHPLRVEAGNYDADVDLNNKAVRNINNWVYYNSKKSDTNNFPFDYPVVMTITAVNGFLQVAYSINEGVIAKRIYWSGSWREWDYFYAM